MSNIKNKKNDSFETLILLISNRIRQIRIRKNGEFDKNLRRKIQKRDHLQWKKNQARSSRIPLIILSAVLVIISSLGMDPLAT